MININAVGHPFCTFSVLMLLFKQLSRYPACKKSNFGNPKRFHRENFGKPGLTFVKQKPRVVYYYRLKSKKRQTWFCIDMSGASFTQLNIKNLKFVLLLMYEKLNYYSCGADSGDWCGSDHGQVRQDCRSRPFFFCFSVSVHSIPVTQKQMAPKYSNVVCGMILGYPREVTWFWG